MLKKLASFVVILMIPLFSFAQSTASLPKSVDSCDDPYLHPEMVEQNSDFLQQGFEIMLFKVIRFPKNTLVPVKIHMDEGQMYQVNFVANRFFQSVSIVLLGKDKEEIFNESFKGKTSQQHWFSKSVAAPYTGDYWIILSQKAKGRDSVCGGLSLLKAVGAAVNK